MDRPSQIAALECVKADLEGMHRRLMEIWEILPFGYARGKVHQACYDVENSMSKLDESIKERQQ